LKGAVELIPGSTRTLDSNFPGSASVSDATS
jgi:hypothetical protein